MAITWFSSPVSYQTYLDTNGTDATWFDVDVSSDVPSGATGVVVRILCGAIARQTAFRKNGSTDNRTAGDLIANTAAIWHVGVDSNRIFEAYLEQGDDPDHTEFEILGYYGSDATFNTNATDKSTGSNDTWTDIDISSDTTGTALAAIVEVYCGVTDTEYAYRNNGSTDANYANPGPDIEGSINFVVGVDGSEIWESCRETTNASIYLLGYITDNVTMYTNGANALPGTEAVWTDFTVNASATGAFFYGADDNAANHTYGARKNGTSLAHQTKGKSEIWNWACPCDVDGKVETYSDAALTGTPDHLYVMGYTEAAVTGPSGSGSATEANDTTTASGKVYITGTASPSETADSATASGKVYITGTASATEANDTATASGDVFITGTGSASEDADTATASGTVADAPITGSGSATEDNDTATASGVIYIAGAASVTEANDTATAAGSVLVAGSGSASEDDDSATASGAVSITGTGSASEDNDTATGTGGSSISGAGAIFEADDTATASGSVLISGSGSTTEADDSATASGNVAIAGGAAVFESNDTATASGNVTGNVTGSGSAAESNDIAAGAGLVLIEGGAGAAEDDDTASGSGTVANDNVQQPTGGFVFPYNQQMAKERWLAEEEDKRKALEALEKELAEAEEAKQEAKDKAAMEAAFLAEQMRLEAEINRLRLERAWLMRMIDDEEAIFVLMSRHPFH